MRRSLTRTTAASAALALVLSLLGQSPALADENRPPDRPDTSTLTARGEACSTDSSRPTLLNDTTLTLRGLITHPDAETVSTQVKAQFEWGLEGADEPLGSADSVYTWDSPGRPPAPRSVTARDLPEEVLIGYRARGHDTRAWGEWSDRCWIEISTSKPAAPPTVTSDDYPDDNRFHGAPGRAGDFTFDANGVEDAVAFYYGMSGSCTTRVELDQPGAEATVRITPQRDGPRSIHARSVDAYGNSSSCAMVYSFLVAPHADPVAYFPLDEGEDSTAHDAMSRGRTAEGTGAIGWARGRVGERAGSGYRLEDTAAVTSDGHLRTEESVVDTSGAFTVSAWVRLDGTDDDAVAVSQDGEHVSGFQLGYDASEEAWVFQRADRDSSDAGFAHRATSTAPAQTGVWTRLVGASDPSTGELSLYVDGVHQETVEQTSAGTAEGAFVIGGGQAGGEFAGTWPGAVDDVLAWNRAPVTADEEVSGGRRSEIWAAANQPVVPEGTWWLGETEGSTAEDATDHGLDAVLHGDPGTVWDGAFNDGIFEPGILLDGAQGEHLRTDGPAVRTDRSFTASAWVRLDDGGVDAVALSQSGSGTSGFALGYDAGLRRWVFEVPVQDGAGSVEVHRVTSATSAWIGEWVHLAGVYDHTDGTLTLHVDGNRAGGAERVDAWHAGGDVVIGGAGHAEGVGRPWTGGVSLAQLHQGVALDSDITRIQFGWIPV
ncbi:LamG domain-containing protein [Nocardiopsis sp. CT-R113]|uniref:LamG domain-containing protein n=1 Tax=Nocardiopsis codii TaxID=3065942 RepID=A0ABU7KEP8_9ACTN|nr:LamG domain-containing protein [Nocardiopsis sp. CT-R113]MEE2040708.1 LamG domain-containing protein [Nocardiopsis sp. CT-R113]